MAAMRASSRCNAAPEQAESGEEQQPEHDVVEIAVAQRTIGPHAEPRTDQRARQRQQREPEHLARDEAASDLKAQGRAEHGAVEDLEHAAALVLGPAANT